MKTRMLIFSSLALCSFLLIPLVPGMAQSDTTPPLQYENPITPFLAMYDNPAVFAPASSTRSESPHSLAWDIETVDAHGGFSSSLVLDSNGYPHIAYQASSPSIHDLNYAHWTGSQWDFDFVDTSGDTGWVLQSLALDDAGHPHIGYGGHQFMMLKYTHWTGSAWAVENVGLDPTAWAYSGGSFTLDSKGSPHMAYCIQTEIPGGELIITLRYAHWTDSKWVIEDVDPDGCWYSTSLRLDADDRPHISYYSDNSLKYAHWTGSEWGIQVVDDRGNTGNRNSLVLDTSGYPHISYHSWTYNMLKYARWTGSEWVVQDVDSAGGESHRLDTALALDASDYAHIAYVDDDNDVLKYAYWTGSQWRTEVVDTSDYLSLGSVVLDDAGNSHLCYTNTDWNLKYAVRENVLPPLLLEKQASPETGLHNNDTLTYTLVLSGADLNVRLWDPLPDAVDYVPGSLTSTITPAAVYSPTAQAVQWQGRLPTDAVQTIRFQVTIGVTGTVGTVLPPIVNTAWLTDTDNGRSVWDTVTVNVNRRYVHLPFVVRN